MKRSGYGYVYIIKLRFGDVLKIGLTRNLRSRMEDLRVGEKCFLASLCVTDEPERLEAKMHALYEPYRIPQSEWFTCKHDIPHCVEHELELYTEGRDIEDFAEVVEWMLYADTFIQEQLKYWESQGELKEAL